MDTKFSSLALKNELLQNLKEIEFHEMTPIQAESLPLMLENKDVLAQAKTGSGKTAAFGLAMLNSLDPSSRNIHSLVLCPTRELAEQVATEIRRLARGLTNIKTITLCGGSSESYQTRSLSFGAHIVVGTPGRVLHHLEKQSLDLSCVNILTLDEADRMLDMGFNDDILEINSYIPPDKQSLLFSATYPENIKDLSDCILKNPVEIKIDVTHESDNIKQVFYEVKKSDDKNAILYKLLNKYRPDRCIIFCRTKKESKDVADFLYKRNIYASCINGDLEQNERTSVLTKFSNRSLSVLVATDVAARGIDIEDLALVVNYNLASSAEAYIHRIGRTGRAGKKGLVFSLFNPVEINKLEEIEDLTKKPCIQEPVPETSDAEKYNLVPPMQTMYINGGKRDKLRPGDIVGALTNDTTIEFKNIGDISVFGLFTYVAITPDKIEEAIDKVINGKVKNKRFKAGFA